MQTPVAASHEGAVLVQLPGLAIASIDPLSSAASQVPAAVRYSPSLHHQHISTYYTYIC